MVDRELVPGDEPGKRKHKDHWTDGILNLQ